MDCSEVRGRYATQLSWPDARLLEWAAEQVSVPKAAPADSFVLHAPLELMARAALLPLVRMPEQERARGRIVALVAEYLDAGASVAPPTIAGPDGLPEAAAHLVAAIDTGDLDEIDRYAAWLGLHASPTELRGFLGPALAPSLAAAGHASIGLHLLGRSRSIGGAVLRGAAREAGRHPDWRVESSGLAAGRRPLVDALLEAPQLGLPGTNFIYPIVSQGAEAATALLADVSREPIEAMRALSRVAAWSMLQDTEEHAPYGWTHCLTIPQAVMSLGLDPALAVAVAGSHMIGFRAAMGTVELDPRLPIPPIGVNAVSDLATTASLHHDAHLVKYVLACFDATTADPEQEGLYLAAAARLADWWARSSAE